MGFWGDDDAEAVGGLNNSSHDSRRDDSSDSFIPIIWRIIRLDFMQSSIGYDDY